MTTSLPKRRPTVDGPYRDKPDFERERDPAAVRAKVQKSGLEHPVMIDNDFAYWKALGNRAWPTFYLVDKKGRIRDRFLGETHAGEPQAIRIERAVEELLAEFESG